MKNNWRTWLRHVAAAMCFWFPIREFFASCPATSSVSFPLTLRSRRRSRDLPLTNRHFFLIWFFSGFFFFFRKIGNWLNCVAAVDALIAACASDKTSDTIFTLDKTKLTLTCHAGGNDGVQFQPIAAAMLSIFSNFSNFFQWFHPVQPGVAVIAARWLQRARF